MKTILHIVGNRPQFIKLAVLHRELAQSGKFLQKIIHTGQHFSHNMSDLFFEELNIPVAGINLNINNLPSPQFIAQAASELEKHFASAGKCIVFVYGDTNTTQAAAIAAKNTNCLLVHFEAGVRTGDANMQEEKNRIVADQLAAVNLCCTERNYSTMIAEGYGGGSSQIYLTGDLMLDAFKKLQKNGREIAPPNSYVACTIHRAENIGSSHSLHKIIEGLNEINRSLPVIVPVHPNTKKMMDQFGCKPAFKRLDPLGYYDMKSLLAGARFVITDSGGTCREAYFLKKPALIIMDKPFWPEIIDAGCALPCNAATESMTEKFFALPGLQGSFETAIFGDGNAARKISAILEAI